ncbi:MAG: MATE family efflux transporter [Defluviitaleaceae bacterium]|nr:MATE family efflux transporter [Defluviitaleaceae bacterium]
MKTFASRIVAFFTGLVSTRHMVKPELQRGEITPTREAYKISLAIAIPAVIEMVSLALMEMINAIMVGGLGTEAFAAVNITSQPRMVFFAVFFALNVSVTAIISRAKGAGEEENARSALRHALLLVLILGVLMTVLSVLFARPMMRLAGAQYDTIDLASSFFRIAAIGMTFQMATGTICAAQRATGNTRITLKVSVTAKIVQIVTNLLLIGDQIFPDRERIDRAVVEYIPDIGDTIVDANTYEAVYEATSSVMERMGVLANNAIYEIIEFARRVAGYFPDLGVDGAAVSIVVVGIVGFILAGASLLQRNSFLRLRKTDDWRPNREMLRTIGRVSSGSMVEQVGLRIGFFLYARVVAGLGTDQFAAHSITMQLMNLSFTFAEGIGAATTALVGQNLGKNRPDLSIMYGKLGMRLAFAAAAFLSITAFLMRHWFPTIFSYDPYVIELATTTILIAILVLPIQTTQVVMGGSLRGAGDVRFVAMTMFVTVGVLRPLAGFVLAYPLGLALAGAWIAIILDQGARLVMLFFRFSGGKWIREKL